MNQYIDQSNFATVTASNTEYKIYLTSPDRDYIQKNLVKMGVPYEISMLTDMKERLSQDSTVLDIGANIGNHTFYLSNVVKCVVVAFEANDDLAHAMNITVSESGLESKVTVHAYALGEKPGFAEFDQLMPDNLGGQSLRKGGGLIKIRTLDSVDIGRNVDAIKIDVEGMEIEVLKGGEKLIEKFLPMLYVECRFKEDFKEIYEYLHLLGYVYQDTFNATPTHLFIHGSKLEKKEIVDKVALKLIEREYDFLMTKETIKKLHVECQEQNRILSESKAGLKLELDRLKQGLNSPDSNNNEKDNLHAQIDLLKEQLASFEKNGSDLGSQLLKLEQENEAMRQNMEQYSHASKTNMFLHERLTTDIERLRAENISYKLQIDAQSDQRRELGDAKRKYSEIVFMLDNTQLELEKMKREILELTQQLASKQNEILVLENKAQHSSNDALPVTQSTEYVQLRTEYQQLKVEHETLLGEVENEKATLGDVDHLTRQTAELEAKWWDQSKRNKQLMVEHESEIKALKILYEQQQRSFESQMQTLMQRKIDSIAPLQINQERINKLVEYRNEIEMLYADQTPILSAFESSDNTLALIKEKGMVLDKMTQVLSDLNSSSIPSST